MLWPSLLSWCSGVAGMVEVPFARASRGDALVQCERPRDHVVEVEAEPLEDGRAGGRGAEAVERDRVALVADTLLPAERDAGLDREPGPHVVRKDLLAILGCLLLEELPAGHRDDAGLRPVLGGELAAGLEREAELGARGDQDQLGEAVDALGVPEDVGAALDAGGGAELAAVEGRDSLARERERDRAIRTRECDLPGVRGLVRVAGP